VNAHLAVLHSEKRTLVCVLSRKLRHSISNFAAHRLVILGGKALQNLRTDCFPLALL
jgi:hypothetical protein